MIAERTGREQGSLDDQKGFCCKLACNVLLKRPKLWIRRSPTAEAVSLYVSGLASRVSDEDLYDHFRGEGKVIDIASRTLLLTTLSQIIALDVASNCSAVNSNFCASTRLGAKSQTAACPGCSWHTEGR